MISRRDILRGRQDGQAKKATSGATRTNSGGYHRGDFRQQPDEPGGQPIYDHRRRLEDDEDIHHYDVDEEEEEEELDESDGRNAARDHDDEDDNARLMAEEMMEEEANIRRARQQHHHHLSRARHRPKATNDYDEDDDDVDEEEEEEAAYRGYQLASEEHPHLQRLQRHQDQDQRQHPQRNRQLQHQQVDSRSRNNNNNNNSNNNNNNHINGATNTKTSSDNNNHHQRRQPNHYDSQRVLGFQHQANTNTSTTTTTTTTNTNTTRTSNSSNTSINNNNNHNQHHNHHLSNAPQMPNNFDPYSIYSDEDDVWYSEERLFEDHLDEIFNKWDQLEDDIWCKLIIMERNRRIGKAYARVPIITVDGSHELSYDGYKLALNGFENPERDAKTDECRKRIGKGIRIKMDNYGNILIKRLSKAAVFVKEWPRQPNEPPPPPLLLPNDLLQQEVGKSQPGFGRLMPSRRELIKNSCCSNTGSKGDSSGASSSSSGSNSSANGGASGAGKVGVSPSVGVNKREPCQAGVASSSSCSSSSAASCSSGRPNHQTGNGKHRLLPSKLMGGREMLASTGSGHNNRSLLSDELLQTGGRLELGKIYVIFDLKQFQANIEAELSRPYPDKQKLEQQCFSLVALGRDAHEMLNLPCWVMIINIVAIEMLNERFPDTPIDPYNHELRDPIYGSSHLGCGLTSGMGPARNENELSKATPSFVSIFERPQPSVSNNDNSTSGGGHPDTRMRRNGEPGAKSEEDPYSLPANASSSDLKSSLGSSSQQDQRLSSQQSSNRYQQRAAASHFRTQAAPDGQQHRQESAMMMMMMKRRTRSNGNIYGQHRGGGAGSESIYSPGHMLVQPTNPNKPPKLPPRDFHRRPPPGIMGGGQPLPVVRSARSVTSVVGLGNDNMTSPSLAPNLSASQTPNSGTANRKTKKNRFLESLRAPLELAKGGSSSHPDQSGQQVSGTSNKAGSMASSGSVSATSGETSKKVSKGLKSLLGVSSKNKTTKTLGTPTNAKDSPEMTGKSGQKSDQKSSKQQQQQLKQKQQQQPANQNYHDLDIPTPDYDLDVGGQQRDNLELTTAGYKCCPPVDLGGGRASRQSKFKEDLYYSGFGAHVPRSARTGPDSGIYGSTGVGGPASAFRHRSASMQRSYAASSASAFGLVGGPARSHTELYDLQTNPYALGPHDIPGHDNYLESPYAMSSSAVDPLAPGRRSGAASGQRLPRRPFPSSGSLAALGPDGVRRRSSSRLGVAGEFGQQSRDTQHVLPTSTGSVYDVGRSSSGIYGVNSSSSSSDYADWAPQSAIAPSASSARTSSAATSMRKVNSSGFLNSLFSSKSSASAPAPPPPLSATSKQGRPQLLPLSQHANMRLYSPHAHHLSTLPPPGAQRHAPFLYGTRQRTGKPASFLGGSSSDPAASGYLSSAKSISGAAHRPARPASALSKPNHSNQNVATTNGGVQNVPTGPNFRSYDSSNDSEPSYTNSSDGLDIYDHIGIYPTGKMGPKFMGAPPEVHVGEWENMYNR